MVRRAVISVFVVCLLVGCSGDPVMRNRFGDERPKILTDLKTGDEYVVEHHMGDTYSVQPLGTSDGM